MSPDYDALWKHIEEQFLLGIDSIHGPRHWRRVEQFGLQLAADNGADITVVRLFAILHDSRRFDEHTDAEHGWRGAIYAEKLRGQWFKIGDHQFEQLYEAIEFHASGRISQDITIGTCWDADRLDLGRVGINPSSNYMSTENAKRFILSKKLFHDKQAN